MEIVPIAGVVVIVLLVVLLVFLFRRQRPLNGNTALVLTDVGGVLPDEYAIERAGSRPKGDT